jgi:hypothetical protein
MWAQLSRSYRPVVVVVAQFAALVGAARRLRGVSERLSTEIRRVSVGLHPAHPLPLPIQVLLAALDVQSTPTARRALDLQNLSQLNETGGAVLGELPPSLTDSLDDRKPNGNSTF